MSRKGQNDATLLTGKDQSQVFASSHVQISAAAKTRPDKEVDGGIKGDDPVGQSQRLRVNDTAVSAVPFMKLVGFSRRSTGR